MRHKTPHVRQQYLRIAIILFAVAAFVLFAVISSWPATGAKAAPTVTPTSPNVNHCMIVEDGICYIVHPAHCVPGTPEIYGAESMGIPFECE